MKKSVKKKDRVKISKKKLMLLVVVIILIAIAAYVVLNRPKTAKQGETVLVNYIGRTNNTIFDTNIESVAKSAGIYNPRRKYEPLNITIGAGEFIKGFEDTLFGMKEGETKTITLPPERAYGLYDEKKVISVPKSKINNSDQIKEGTILRDSKGGIVRVVAVNETSITVDTNPLLAGRTLEFEITLVKIK